AARLAARMKGDLRAVHVASTDGTPSGDEANLDRLRQLADDLGAHWHEVRRDDPARALVDFAGEHQVTQIVLGSSGRSRWAEMTRGSVVQRVLRFASDGGVDVHIIARRHEDSLPNADRSMEE
ncbi:MAG: universal stress protein, partial [Acidimicrobiales bacterium]